MKPSFILAAIIVILALLSLGSYLAAKPSQQTAFDGSHNHPYLETSIAEVRIEANSTNSRQGTEIAVLQATRQTLPSPTHITLTPTPPSTWTRTPSATNTLAIPATPTPEGDSGLTRTPLTAAPPRSTNTPTRTPVATSSGGATSLPFLDPAYTCRIVTTDNLTRRETPSPAAQSLGVIPDGTELTIHPYDGSIPLNSTLWYVRIADISGGGWILYARIDPNAGTVEPRVTDSYLSQVSELCIPALRRS